MKNLWFANLSNSVLWFTFVKAIINTTFVQLELKTTTFKATEKKKAVQLADGDDRCATGSQVLELWYVIPE